MAKGNVRTTIEVEIPRGLARDLSREARHQQRTLDSLAQEFLREGLGQIAWSKFGDALVADVKETEAREDMTPKEKDTYKRDALQFLAHTVATATSNGRKAKKEG